jgi:hypothetical protein
MEPAMLRRVPLILIPLLAAACATSRPPAPPPFYLNRPVSRLVVLPPFNETIAADAWRTAWPHLIRGVETRGYAVVPQAEVEEFYKKNRFFNTPEEIQIYTPVEVAKEFKADGVLYTNLQRWGYRYVGVYSEYGVAMEFRMTDGKTGDPVWQDRVEVMHAEAAQGRNLFELALSLIGVAGNAFLRSSDAWAEDAVARAMWKLPMAGYDPSMMDGNMDGKLPPAPPPADLEKPGTKDPATESEIK